MQVGHVPADYVDLQEEQREQNAAIANNLVTMRADQLEANAALQAIQQQMQAAAAGGRAGRGLGVGAIGVGSRPGRN